MIIEAGGARQLIVWDAKAVTSLNPVTGAIYWEQPFPGASEMNIAMAHKRLAAAREHLLRRAADARAR